VRSISEVIFNFGPNGPSSEGTWETTTTLQPSCHDQPNSPCLDIVHAGYWLINTILAQYYMCKNYLPSYESYDSFVTHQFDIQSTIII
jgi:hypothetical protein